MSNSLKTQLNVSDVSMHACTYSVLDHLDFLTCKYRMTTTGEVTWQVTYTYHYSVCVVCAHELLIHTCRSSSQRMNQFSPRCDASGI